MNIRSFGIWLVLASCFMAANANATTIGFTTSVDDFGKWFIDGNLIGSYDNPLAQGGFSATLDLAPGWHTTEYDYANRLGSNVLALSWDLTGGTNYVTIPNADLRSQDGVGNTISGLRADYSNLNGNALFTVYGEGPIYHGALIINGVLTEVYENAPGLWGGQFGPFSLFQEKLTGEIFVPAPPSEVPEPATLTLTALGMAGIAKRYRRRRFRF